MPEKCYPCTCANLLPMYPDYTLAAAQQSLAADGAIAFSSSNLFTLAWMLIVRRSLKASVRR
jgi:hypothetical protein